jgi:hypothetical protein
VTLAIDTGRGTVEIIRSGFQMATWYAVGLADVCFANLLEQRPSLDAQSRSASREILCSYGIGRSINELTRAVLG